MKKKKPGTVSAREILKKEGKKIRMEGNKQNTIVSIIATRITNNKR